MGSLKSLTLLALLLSLSLVVIADTSKDATNAKNEVKPSEATDTVEPQQGWGGGCRYGCCGGWMYGRCSYCCARPQAAEAMEADQVVEPQQGFISGGCRYGCCGPWHNGRCGRCCRSPQAEAEVVEPQQGFGRGGCRYGCCGPWRNGRCSYCCRSSQAEAEVVEPQQKNEEEAKP